MTVKINPQLQQLFDQMPDAWGCKDNHSVFLYANENYCRLVGLNHPKEAIGRTDFDMPCQTSNCANLFRAQDQRVMQLNQKIRILDIHPFAGNEWKAYIFTKTPLTDPNLGVIGTIFHGVDVTSRPVIEIGALLAKMSLSDVSSPLVGQNSYMLSTHFSGINLTQRQSEVLFFLLRGKTAKHIAVVLSISFRTVEAYIEQLKHKFSAANKEELIELAITAGFLSFIPKSLFRAQLSEELKE